MVNLEFNKINNEPIHILITDLAGKTIYNEVLQGDIGKVKTQINLCQWPDLFLIYSGYKSNKKLILDW